MPIFIFLNQLTATSLANVFKSLLLYVFVSFNVFNYVYVFSLRQVYIWINKTTSLTAVNSNDFSKDIQQKTLDHSVVIVNFIGEDFNSGSGFVLPNGYIITAGHVVKDKDQERGDVFAGFRDNEVLYPVERVRIPALDHTDIYVLRLPSVLRKVNEGLLLTSDYGKDTKIMLVGNPVDERFKSVFSKINDFSYMVDPVGLLEVFVFFNCNGAAPGFSGSALVDTNGKVVGMMTFRSNIHDIIGFGDCGGWQAKTIIQYLDTADKTKLKDLVYK